MDAIVIGLMCPFFPSYLSFRLFLNHYRYKIVIVYAGIKLSYGIEISINSQFNGFDSHIIFSTPY